MINKKAETNRLEQKLKRKYSALRGREKMAHLVNREGELRTEFFEAPIEKYGVKIWRRNSGGCVPIFNTKCSPRPKYWKPVIECHSKFYYEQDDVWGSDRSLERLVQEALVPNAFTTTAKRYDGLEVELLLHMLENGLELTQLTSWLFYNFLDDINSENIQMRDSRLLLVKNGVYSFNEYIADKLFSKEEIYQYIVENKKYFSKNDVKALARADVGMYLQMIEEEKKVK